MPTVSPLTSRTPRTMTNAPLARCPAADPMRSRSLSPHPKLFVPYAQQPARDNAALNPLTLRSASCPIIADNPPRSSTGFGVFRPVFLVLESSFQIRTGSSHPSTTSPPDGGQSDPRWERLSSANPEVKHDHSLAAVELPLQGQRKPATAGNLPQQDFSRHAVIEIEPPLSPGRSRDQSKHG